MADEPPRKSLSEDSREEARRYRWIESERAGCDLGEAAVRQWVIQHWQGYLRARWIEHLEGKCFWIELDQRDFGILSHLAPEQSALLTTILDKLKTGCENLDILCWARSNSIPFDEVRRILEAIDINSARVLASRFKLHPPDKPDPPIVVNGHG